jgi:glucose/arabinose dehydrogenase
LSAFSKIYQSGSIKNGLVGKTMPLIATNKRKQEMNQSGSGKRGVVIWLKSLLVLVLALVLIPLGFIFLGPVSSPAILLNAIFGVGIKTPEQDVLSARLQLPPGFSVSVYARDLPMARFMRLSEKSDLLLSRPRQGEVLLLERDLDRDGRADGRQVLMQGLKRPHGLELWQGWLYVAESDAIGRIRFDHVSGKVSGEYQRIITNLPDTGNHWTKTIGIGPDGWLYLSIGSSCNVCEEADKRRATIMRFLPDGSEGEIYASGLRNSVGLDWAPWDQALYATDNGRDFLGDDSPPCELNKIEQHGFYGWPYINGFGEADPQYGTDPARLPGKAISPVHGFRAHNAPLGMTFVRSGKLTGYERSALVALHGSWNRSVPDGYKVVSLSWLADGSIVERDFLSGFLRDGTVIGRPVDVVEGSDGSIYVSDDYAGAVYRIAYQEAETSTALIKDVFKPKGQKSAMFESASYDAGQLASLQAQGEKLYRLYQCAQCHEEKEAASVRTGDVSVIKPLTALQERFSVEQLAVFLASPTPPMPNFNLSKEQRLALSFYLLQR